MELLYVWIDKHNNIKNLGFNLSSRFLFQYNQDSRQLTIEKNPNHIENFFPEGIINLTAIIGENGAGKTSLLEALASMSYFSGNWFLAGEYENGIYNIYPYYDSEEEIEILASYPDIKIKPNDKEKFLEDGSPLLSILWEHFISIKYSPLDITNQKFYMNNVDYNFSSGELYVNSESQFGRNQTERQFIFLGKKGNRELLPFSFLPKMPVFELANFFKLLRDLDEIKIKNKYKILALAQKEINDSIDTQTTVIITTWGIIAILLQIVNGIKNSDIILDLESVDKSSDIFGMIWNHLKTIGINNDFKIVEEFIEFFNDFAKENEIKTNLSNEWNKNTESMEFRSAIFKKDFKFNVFIDYFFPKYKELIDKLNQNIPTLPLFNFKWTGLSSGEIAILNLYSLFYYISEDVNKKKNSGDDREKNLDNLIIFIDEGEVGLHPQWQKNYLNNLLDYFPKIFKGKKIQIILTSHSPLLVSDLSTSNIIFMEKAEDGSAIIKDSLHGMKETFGANIHTILTDGFFIKDGLIGEYAKKKINEVIKFLNNQESEVKDDDTAQKYIRLIGEPIVRNQLQKMLDSKRLTKVDEIDQIKEQIDGLKIRLKILEDDTNKV